MPPKTTGMPQDEFLAACFKFSIEKPRVDFARLAAAIGMSTGGAANKFRAIMKQYEDDGTAQWTKDDVPTGGETPKKKATPKRKSPGKITNKSGKGSDDSDHDDIGATLANANGNAEVDVDDGLDDETSKQEPVKKKTRTATPKKVAGSAAKGRGKGKTPASNDVRVEPEDDVDDTNGEAKEVTGSKADPTTDQKNEENGLGADEA